ncbi:MAG TPA: hypothetical protein VMZ73_02280 [Acidimicrobiales bacterium]|nr:hypothetical protein [Acidimicrobiales bacterium]
MRLDVGPVAPASAVAWMDWAEEVFGELRNEPPTRVSLPAAVFDDIGGYLEQWMPHTRVVDRPFRWQAEIDPDKLEYLVHALFKLDTRLLAEAQRGERPGSPEEGRLFYLVLVRALLHALEVESPTRAAFVDQLRSSWPIAVVAC